MKKVIFTLFAVLVMSVPAFGVVSQDFSVYVRRDVYEVQQQSTNAKLDMLIEQQKKFQEELKAQRQDISELTRLVSVMSERTDRNFDTLSGRIDGLNSRMGDQQNYLYLLLVILGIIVALPSVQKFLHIERSTQVILNFVGRSASYREK